MSEILKSMENALEDLESQADNGFSADVEEEDTDSDDLNFELFKADDLEEFDGKKIDVDPFLHGIAYTVDSNNERVARAIESSLNIIKAQSGVITQLCSKVDRLQDVVDEMAATPRDTKAALSKGEADKLSASIFDKGFTNTEDAESTSLEPNTDNTANAGLVKAHIVNTLRKSYDARVDGYASLAQDIVTIDSVPVGFSENDMLSMLSPVGKKIVRESVSGNESE